MILFYSDDGKNWIQWETSHVITHAVYAKGIWVFCGTYGIHYSTDGQIIKQSNVTGTISGVYYANGVFVAGGAHGLWYSFDGVFWTQSNVTTSIYSMPAMNRDGIWVVGAGSSGIYYSVTWEQS
mgnify:FL=1